jgi:hypothetical protein
VIIVDPRRGNRAPFHRRMAELGYALQETRIEDLDGPHAPYRGSLFHYQRSALACAATGLPHGQN